MSGNNPNVIPYDQPAEITDGEVSACLSRLMQDFKPEELAILFGATQVPQPTFLPEVDVSEPGGNS